MNAEPITSLEDYYRKIAREEAAALYESKVGPLAEGPEEYRQKLALINAKEFLTAREAAFLLGCSDGHLRNLVREAKRGRKRHPVPFRDLDGVYTFPRVELLAWAEKPKQRLKAVS